jgi:hypothetical protein
VDDSGLLPGARQLLGSGAALETYRIKVQAEKLQYVDSVSFMS